VEEDANARATRLAAANLGSNRRPSFGSDPRKGGGVFGIERLSYDSAEFTFFGWKSIDYNGVMWFLAAGFFNASAQFLVIEAFRLGRAARVAPFRYSGLLWAMLIGFLAWGEVPDAWMAIGAAIVAWAGVYMSRRSTRPA